MTNIEMRRLSELMAYKALARKLSTRDISKETGISSATVWRTIHYPTRVEAKSLIAVLEYLGILLDKEFLDLWHVELKEASIEKIETAFRKANKAMEIKEGHVK